MRYVLPTLVLIVLLSSYSVAPAQTGVEALRDSVTTAMQDARTGEYDVYSPLHFERAQKAYDEAEAMTKKGGEPSLLAVKYRVAMDEIAAARTSARAVRTNYPEMTAMRTAARTARADSLVPAAWQRAEQSFTKAIREVENGRTLSPAEADEIAGSFRAARRDALRTSVLGEVWQLSGEMDRRHSEKLLPVLSLRVHQAISRAEAALAKDSLDLARAEGEKAALLARRTLNILTHVERAQKADAPWEAAILPYEDLLDSLAGCFHTSLDYSGGVSSAAKPFLDRVNAHEDSVDEQLRHLKDANAALEQSLSVAQTGLADAQNRVTELERRMSAAEGERTTTRARLQVSDQISRAQGHFPAGQAIIMQNDSGEVVIRLVGLRFQSGATKVTKSASKLLDKALEAIGEFPDATLSVRAHTDSDGSAEMNQRLSDARAANVRDYLAAKLNLPKDKFPAIGYGASQPIADNKTEAGKAQNRRVEIVLTLPK